MGGAARRRRVAAAAGAESGSKTHSVAQGVTTSLVHSLLGSSGKEKSSQAASKKGTKSKESVVDTVSAAVVVQDDDAQRKTADASRDDSDTHAGRASSSASAVSSAVLDAAGNAPDGTNLSEERVKVGRRGKKKGAVATVQGAEPSEWQRVVDMKEVELQVQLDRYKELAEDQGVSDLVDDGWIPLDESCLTTGRTVFGRSTDGFEISVDADGPSTSFFCVEEVDEDVSVVDGKDVPVEVHIARLQARIQREDDNDRSALAGKKKNKKTETSPVSAAEAEMGSSAPGGGCR